MSYNVTLLGKRLVNLVKAVRQINFILPGDKIKLIGERPATYLGAIESGDLLNDYLQMHIFKLYDGLHVVLEAPSLNRYLGKYLF
jgi:hypothetical protein